MFDGTKLSFGKLSNVKNFYPALAFEYDGDPCAPMVRFMVPCEVHGSLCWSWVCIVDSECSIMREREREREGEGEG